MGEIGGAVAAVVSSALGGSAIAATRYLAPFADPFLIGAFRFGIGFLLLCPIALLSRETWPARRDWPATVALGLMFFAVFPFLFNSALGFTTAARGSLALSTMPIQTMLVAAAFGIEALTLRKTLGVILASAGVALALLSGLSAGTGAPPGAWRGDLLMLLAALCMSCTSIAARGVLARSGPFTFTSIAMLVGTLALIGLASARGSLGAVAAFGTAQWVSALYLGIVGGAVCFFLWSFALRHTTPTLAGISVAVNPISASLVGTAILGEALSWSLAMGLAAVFCGIWLVVVPARKAKT